jgi:hypothetical protein
MPEQVEKRIEVSVDTLTTETAEMVLSSIINQVAMRHNEYQIASAAITLLSSKAKEFDKNIKVPE